jgi:hypothetical protein
MEYVGFILGIFGFMAYLQFFSLKNRVNSLERELTLIKGTSFHEDRTSLLEAARSLIGKDVKIDLKEDHMDFDIVNYGNTKYGSNRILDADREWMLVCIESAKGNKEKLIRMESIARISLKEN